MQAMGAIRPYIDNMTKEKQEISRTYQAHVLKQDNFELRRNIIYYSTFGIFALSFMINKKGYIRYSTRNALMYYVAASYALCPENLNPF
jgi:hypothetical protein